MIQRLRAPDGCPWDAEQTHESIRKNFIEETYEAVEAIDNGDKALLKEELGDVLLQVIYHAAMEEEAGEFTIDDVCHDVVYKLVVRHPHIFGDVKADTAEAAFIDDLLTDDPMRMGRDNELRFIGDKRRRQPVTVADNRDFLRSE